MAQRSLLRRVTYWVTALLLRFGGAIFLGLRFGGGKNVPRTGGALLCCNHQSYFDPVLIGACSPRRMNYVARETLFHGPLGWMLRWYDAIPIQREGIGIGGIKESLRRLKRGELLLIFPEGTRSPDGKLQSLQPGFTSLARRAQVPIVPLAIDGAYQAWPRSERLPHLERIRIEVGDPLSWVEIEGMDDPTLIAEVEQRIARCLRKAGDSR